MTKRFTSIYNEKAEMMQYVDNQKEEPNRWAIWNATETTMKLNELAEENEQLKQQIDNICREVTDTTTTTELVVKLQGLLF